MESTVTRPAIDVGPTGARPGLAFILALLAIPGSTLAWDLPAGRVLDSACPSPSQRSPSASSPAAGSPGPDRSKLALAAIIIGGLVIAQMVVYSIVSAFFRHPAPGPSAGPRASSRSVGGR